MPVAGPSPGKAAQLGLRPPPLPWAPGAVSGPPPPRPCLPCVRRRPPRSATSLPPPGEGRAEAGPSRRPRRSGSGPRGGRGGQPTCSGRSERVRLGPREGAAPSGSPGAGPGRAVRRDPAWLLLPAAPAGLRAGAARSCGAATGAFPRVRWGRGRPWGSGRGGRAMGPGAAREGGVRPLSAQRSPEMPVAGFLSAPAGAAGGTGMGLEAERAADKDGPVPARRFRTRGAQRPVGVRPGSDAAPSLLPSPAARFSCWSLMLRALERS